MSASTSTTCWIGAHTSIQGGLWHALEAGGALGATTIQCFTANQRRWQAKPLSSTDIAMFCQWKEKLGMKHLMSHASYLVNLGSPKKEMHHKSVQAFEQEIKRCQQLQIDYLNFHPGAALDQPKELCLQKIAKTLLHYQPLFSDGKLRLLLESTAGQGSTIGASFEELGYLVHEVMEKIPIGVCLDTCHLFAAGYDIRTDEAWDKTLALFDEKIGLEHLYAFHLNDSKFELGLRKDRHANLGEGKIGWDCFAYLMKNPRTRALPKYLETPNGTERWGEEIQQLKSFASEK